MTTSPLALLLLTPFIAVFAYAAWHEWHRARTDGHSNYGLAYDPETDTTHVTLLEEDETGYDPEADHPQTGDDTPGDDTPDADKTT